jgi:hypothetical protein
MRRIGICLFEVVALASLFVPGTNLGFGQAGQPRDRAPAAAPGLAGPRFKVADREMHTPATIIAYGDMRFTDPGNVTATSPAARRALVARIAEEKPDVVLLNGDVPWHGGDSADYSVFAAETQPWRDAHLRIFPALGNHELSQCDLQQCLENWWQAFPELNGVRWYSAQLGTKLYVIALDSDDSLLPDSEQAHWLEAQIASLPKGIRFVFITMHHPPVADIQTKLFIDHNPRLNEIALANLLKDAARKTQAKFVVIAGHIHNYERFQQDGVTYLVSGGGGAVPYPVERTPADAYQDPSFPNYHYLKFVLAGDILNGTMYRLADPRTTKWEIKDTFEVR